MNTEKQQAQSLTPRQQDYIEVENHCCLCGTELIFQHSPEDSARKVKEIAHCPCCKIHLREKEFLIH